MKGARILLVALALFLGAAVPALAAAFRFPMPDFESGYQLPEMKLPLPKAGSDLLDMAVLLGALSLSAFLVIKRRSRRAIFLLTVFSVLYFGFWRKG
ncbi:MAG: LPXTG cell wall anchor domain-containing protein, partial [Candidatus Hydrogenedentes bacterium]|nr:LPXTG cell wall anchor domain-containing protein [Candidatus Hydrogenedentota bacterium]